MIIINGKLRGKLYAMKWTIPIKYHLKISYSFESIDIRVSLKNH